MTPRIAAWLPLPGALREAFAPAPGPFRAVRLGDFPQLQRVAPKVIETFSAALALAGDADAWREWLGTSAEAPESEVAAAAWVLRIPYEDEIEGRPADLWWAKLRAQERAILSGALIPHLLSGFGPALRMEPPKRQGKSEQVEVLYQSEEAYEDGPGWWLQLVCEITAELTHDLGKTLAMTLAQAVAFREGMRYRAGWSAEFRGYVGQEVAAHGSRGEGEQASGGGEA